VAEGFRHLGYNDDHALNSAEWTCIRVAQQ